MFALGGPHHIKIRMVKQTPHFRSRLRSPFLRLEILCLMLSKLTNFLNELQNASLWDYFCTHDHQWMVQQGRYVFHSCFFKLKKKKNQQTNFAPKHSSMYLNSFYHFLNFQRGNESKPLLLKPYAYLLHHQKKKKNLQNTEYI